MPAQSKGKKRRGLGEVAVPRSRSTQRLEEVKASAITYGAIGLGALILGAGGYLGVRTLLRDIQQHNAEDNATIDGKPEYWAGNLLTAFEGYGTDEDLVFKTLREIPSLAVWEKVIRAYSKLTRGKSLTADLRDELVSFYSTGDYQTALQIINSKPQK